ncbi:MAG: CPBP family intramembrane metalloprotease [Planctomycetes bacterium]|nr:CPBP family intramembrane metalloprotease [Planctomycetota bacterium]
MGRRKAARRGSAPPSGEKAGGDSILSASGYFERSKQPLEILALVAPLIVLYEIGLVFALRTQGGTLTNSAHEGLLRLFSSLGIDAGRFSLPALALPGVGVIVVLLVWQVLSRRAWTLHIPTVGGMMVECVLFSLPLLVAAQIITRIFPPAAMGEMEGLGTFGKVAMSVGAGVYEELVFRMVLIALLHTLFVDLLRWKESWALGVAVIVAAVLFTLYHPLRLSSGALDLRRVVFFLAAGSAFGVLYVVRGFGIAAGTHAWYDVAVVVLLAPPDA